MVGLGISSTYNIGRNYKQDPVTRQARTGRQGERQQLKMDMEQKFDVRRENEAKEKTQLL
jgi:hypothetical protein